MYILPDYGMLISSIRRMLRMLFIRIIRYNSSNVHD